MYAELNSAIRTLAIATEDHKLRVLALQGAVTPFIESGQQADDVSQLIQVFDNVTRLCGEIRADANRRELLRRVRAAERRLREAAAQVLDNRFNAMSDTILAWWSSIRPEELVDFAGIRRRAGGATFVNLVAALHPDPGAPPVERDALGVYSDSQLNALGLSIFLARNELLNSSPSYSMIPSRGATRTIG